MGKCNYCNKDGINGRDRADELDIAVEDIPDDRSLFNERESVYAGHHPGHVERYQVDRHDYPEPVQFIHSPGNRRRRIIHTNALAPCS